MAVARLLYRDFVVNPDRLPTLASSAGVQVQVFTAATGGSPVTDLTADAAGQQALDQLLTDASGSWSVYVPGNLTADGVLWFQVVGSAAGRYPLGPTSGFMTKASADGAYGPLLAVWQPNTAYPFGQLVVYNGSLYLALAPVPARATFAAGDWFGPLTPPQIAALGIVTNSDGSYDLVGDSTMFTANPDGTYDLTIDSGAVTANPDGTYDLSGAAA